MIINYRFIVEDKLKKAHHKECSHLNPKIIKNLKIIINLKNIINETVNNNKNVIKYNLFFF